MKVAGGDRLVPKADRGVKANNADRKNALLLVVFKANLPCQTDTFVDWREILRPLFQIGFC